MKAGFAALLLVLLLAPNSLSAATDIEVNVCYPPTTPTIDSPADGTQTDESSVLMTGTATAGNDVYAIRNGDPVGFTTAAGDGSYSISVSLVVGSNTLQASAENACGDAEPSATIAVTRSAPPPDPEEPEAEAPDAEAPVEPTQPSPTSPESSEPPDEDPNEPSLVRPVISEPTDGTEVSKQNILVRGKAARLTVVRLLNNGRQVAEVLSDDRGNFAVSVVLVNGENHLAAVTGQGEDKQTSDTVTVRYKPEAADRPDNRALYFWVFGGVGLASVAVISYLTLGFQAKSL